MRKPQVNVCMCVRMMGSRAKSSSSLDTHKPAVDGIPRRIRSISTQSNRVRVHSSHHPHPQCESERIYLVSSYRSDSNPFIRTFTVFHFHHEYRISIYFLCGLCFGVRIVWCVCLSVWLSDCLVSVWGGWQGSRWDSIKLNWFSFFFFLFTKLEKIRLLINKKKMNGWWWRWEFSTLPWSLHCFCCCCNAMAVCLTNMYSRIRGIYIKLLIVLMIWGILISISSSSLIFFRL